MACCLTEERIKGAFSLAKTSKVGAGTTARKVTRTIYVYAAENDEGQLEVQAVNDNHVPTGPVTVIGREALLRDYFPEPEYYQKHMFPAMRELARHLAGGERQLKNGQPYSAEVNFHDALKLDEQNIRANFGIGLSYLQRGEKDKAGEVLKRIVTLEAAFEGRHKHLFNEFGIQLRKNGMYDEALEYYGRALEFARDDENLHFNMARAALAKGDPALARENLARCLALNPSMPEARDYLARLERGESVGPGDAAPAEAPAPA